MKEPAHRSCKRRVCSKCDRETIKLITEVRAEARQEFFEEVMSHLFLECQPTNGALFSRMDDVLRRALKDRKQ